MPNETKNKKANERPNKAIPHTVLCSAQKTRKEILVPLIGVYESAGEIGFEDLPERFVCKASHGSGWNIVATDKAKLNWPVESQKLKKWMATDFSIIGREWAYKNSPKKILIEEFLMGQMGNLLTITRFSVSTEIPGLCRLILIDFRGIEELSMI